MAPTLTTANGGSRSGMSLGRTLIVIGSMLCLGASTIAPTLAATGNRPHNPDGCPPEYGEGAKPGTDSNVALATSTYSYWLTGPGSISYTTSSTATSSYTVSGSFSYTISDVVSSANATFGISVQQENSKSSSWTYNLTVPSGETARGQVWHEALKFEYGKWSVNEACTYTWSALDWYYTPYSSTDNSHYEISLNVYPGATIKSWP